MNWTDYFLSIAETVSLKSKDKSTKVGCVIYDDENRIRSVGFNGFPQGVREETSYKKSTFEYEEVLKRYERPLKLKYTECAERNAIYSAARTGMSLDGCFLVVNGLPPCVHCARAIIQVGIKIVRYCCDGVPERWLEDYNISKIMFGEADVELIKIDR